MNQCTCNQGRTPPCHCGIAAMQSDALQPNLDTQMRAIRRAGLRTWLCVSVFFATMAYITVVLNTQV